MIDRKSSIFMFFRYSYLQYTNTNTIIYDSYESYMYIAMIVDIFSVQIVDNNNNNNNNNRGYIQLDLQNLMILNTIYCCLLLYT